MTTSKDNTLKVTESGDVLIPATEYLILRYRMSALEEYRNMNLRLCAAITDGVLTPCDCGIEGCPPRLSDSALRILDAALEGEFELTRRATN